MTSSLAASLLLFAALVVLPALYARDAARARKQRTGFFAECLPLFVRYRVTVTGQAFPVLEGRYGNTDVRLELVLDDMAWRKLPSLWLKATIFQPNPARSVVDFLMRPQGGEFYSPSGDMVHRLPIPAAWPQNAILCADRKEASSGLGLLAPHMGLFEDPRAKELVTSPRGVRLVYQAAQAERAHYLVLRQARFENNKVDPALVRSLLERAIAIAAVVDGVAEDRQTEAA
jgi:hypothetical protein